MPKPSDRLYREWYGAKPGAFLPKPRLKRLHVRLGSATSAITDRWRVLRTRSP